MANNIVLTLTGRDKIGLVDQVTSLVVTRNGNVESSRMAHLGGEFAMLMLIKVPTADVSELDHDFQPMRSEGYQITLVQTDEEGRKFAGWLPYEIEVTGADHEGIIQQISHHLASQGINIESMDTSAAPAPMSGTPLFTMKGIVLVPPKLNFNTWSDALEEVGDKLNVSVKVEVVK
jgi:glycine cleavage system transcriptional repressor